MNTTSRTDFFEKRHIGPGPDELAAMLETIGLASLDQLIDQTIPEDIRRKDPIRLPPPLTESEYLEDLRQIGAKNTLFRSFIGMGYNPCTTPSVILRNVLENPGWYTPYTPYQAEIAQGRLEALLNFQTMVSDLTGMEVANASLLDEATAAAEAMCMLHRLQRKKVAAGATRFLVEPTCWPQTVSVLRSRAEPLGIELIFGGLDDVDLATCFGLLLQYPDGTGAVRDPQAAIKRAHAADLLVVIATDPLALVLLTPPGKLGADVVVGSAQRFGVPMGYGGPHAAFFSTRKDFVREMPGRIIGVSVDRDGQPAYRMSLQTREQHIRREKAKSNICTAQALLATMAGMYAVYHGPSGLLEIAARVHGLAKILDAGLRRLGLNQENDNFFDTLLVELPPGAVNGIRVAAEAAKINLRYIDDTHIGISVNETTVFDDLVDVVTACAAGLCVPPPALIRQEGEGAMRLDGLDRAGELLAFPVFRQHHSESRMMRYLKQLERKDIGLDTSMIPLGSCTMKLNAAAEMIPVTWPEFGGLHPFAPRAQARGYAEIFDFLEKALAEITGFAAASLQPNSGAQGEYAGLMVIREFHLSRGDAHRNVVLIPSSAHGTNPASAVMCGMEVVVVACDEKGNVNIADLEKKASAHAANLAALMVTYPSTHGVFEEGIRKICSIIHAHGGQVYMDGANLNAQVGLTSPALIGADVCHINLHKTFAIPHGGGGPGMGPIAVAAHLAPFLPGSPVVDLGLEKGIHAVSAAPWGSASILLIPYGYIRMLGAEGITNATRYAILNANYMKARLEGAYEVLFTGANGRVAHEMIFDLRPIKEKSELSETDVAKRLMDYGFHAPTVSWPVPGTMMIEPTESEDKDELDRFCNALLEIRREMQDVLDGHQPMQDNVLMNAPHTARQVCADQWTRPYSREKAAFPLDFVRANKVWPSVARIDNTYGDRNLVCSCAPVSAYAD